MYPFAAFLLYIGSAMEIAGILEKARSAGWSDEEIVEQVKSGNTALYEVVMRRYNQRLYRVARAILHNDDEAEDVMQAAYVHAYEHLHQFAGRAPFSTWLTRIAVHEALARLRLRGRNQQFEDTGNEGDTPVKMVDISPDPEQSASRAELNQFLEQALLGLPLQYRAVVMLRDVEDLSTSETASALDLTEENVKIRLHRGRAMMRAWLIERVGANAKNTFSFMGARCDRVVNGVFARLASQSSDPEYFA
jgi:RNA polymerase sigma-70 factor (ECF subfamily)